LDYHNQFRDCLIDLDIEGAMRIWSHVFPQMPQPQRRDALAVMHMARTAMLNMPYIKRFYSHRWCCDEGFPSQLPDELKPRAEKLYPSFSSAVGISANSKYPEIAEAIGRVMREAVLETYADGHKDEPKIVRARMMEKREIARRGLGLNWSKSAP
jgi:hypothetical protein